MVMKIKNQKYSVHLIWNKYANAYLWAWIVVSVDWAQVNKAQRLVNGDWVAAGQTPGPF